MAAKHVINVDLAKVFSSPEGKGLQRVLTWGSPVEVVDQTTSHVEIKGVDFERLPDGSIKPKPLAGFIVPPKGIKPADVVIERSKSQILKVDFVDVQQGDGTVIETPRGKVVLLDGGDNAMFARYLASRFRGTSQARPKEIDCIVVSHGDADHFDGLTEIHRSETNSTAFKRLFIHPRRVYHNGIVKRPSTRNGKKVKDTELLGGTVKAGKDLIITDLATDLLEVPDDEMNKPFRDWKAALTAFRTRGPIEFQRLSQGDDAAFDFLADEDVKVQVLGPIPTSVGSKTGLKFLRTPRKGPRQGPDVISVEPDEQGSLSASHTINGHSIVLRLTYKGVSFLFSGDLNDEAGRILTRAHNRGERSLQAEVFKVPHHGSADFSGALLQAVSPVVSIVSSGDENSQKEYIHPRATLVGALGKYSRLEEPLVFVTELVAFFQVVGKVTPEKGGSPFFAFSRAAFGIVMVRTDGQRLLVCTNSGRTELKEAYAFVVDDHGKTVPVAVRSV